MPDYLASSEADEPIEIPGTGGKTVTFKTCASYADELACDIAGFQGPDQETRLSSYFLARTVRMILAWELEDAAGAPLPISPDSLRGLKANVGKFLEDEARVRFEGRPEEDERPFERPSSPLSVAAG